MTRLILLIVIHASDSDIKRHDNISVITRWHLERGFNDVGYHYFIRKDGKIQKGRDEEIVGAHAKGHNTTSIGICLSGRVDFTLLQGLSLMELITRLKEKYPMAKIVPHNSLNNHKTCPNFEHDFIFGGFDDYEVRNKY